VATGFTKPMASKHQVGLVGLLGAGHFDHLAVLELDADGLQTGDLAFLADNSLVEMANSRSQPSSWLELVRSLSGQ
jgi:hypothetical protein